jgi:serine/threonine protein kinase
VDEESNKPVRKGGGPEEDSPGYRRGDLVARRYRLRRVLGKGGMGLVWSAVDLKSERRVALKVILPSAVGGDNVARFEREARAAACLASPHTVRVHDVGRLESGAPFLVMELLVGLDLGALLERAKTIPLHAAVLYVIQAARGVAAAHALGIVHRDLKPRNLFLVAQEDVLVKVLDFGLAKSATPDDPTSLTSSNTIVGSPEYMSPEQLRRPREVDVRTDVWSLGVCLYELITGKSPFTAQSVPDLMARILYDTPERLDALVRGVPAGLADVVERCLKKDPNRRFADAAALAAALEPFADALRRPLSPDETTPPHIMAFAAGASDEDPSPSAATTVTVTLPPASRIRRTAQWAVVAGAAVALSCWLTLAHRAGQPALARRQAASPLVLPPPSVMALAPEPPNLQVADAVPPAAPKPSATPKAPAAAKPRAVTKPAPVVHTSGTAHVPSAYY